MMNTKISRTLGFANTIMKYVPIFLTSYSCSKHSHTEGFFFVPQQFRLDNADDPTTYLVSFDEAEARYLVST